MSPAFEMLTKLIENPKSMTAAQNTGYLNAMLDVLVEQAQIWVLAKVVAQEAVLENNPAAHMLERQAEGYKIAVEACKESIGILP